MESAGLDQNLIASPYKPTRKPVANPEPPLPKISRRKRLLKFFFYFLLAIFSFLTFFLAQMPSALLNNLLGALSNQTPYYWQADSSKLRILLRPHLHFENLTLTPRFGDTTASIQFSTFDLTPNFFRSIPWKGALTPSFDFNFNAYGSDASGSANLGLNTEYSLNAENLPLGKIPQIKTLNLGLQALLSSLQLHLQLEQGAYSRANGKLHLSGTKLSLDPSGFNSGLPIPILDIGPLLLNAQITNGQLRIEKLTLGDSTHDLEIIIDGGIKLHDPIDFSDFDLRIKFKIADKILKATPGLESMIPIIAVKRQDGYYGTKVSGALGSSLPVPMND